MNNAINISTGPVGEVGTGRDFSGSSAAHPIDLAAIARILHDRCSADIEPDELTVDYVKFRRSGPVLATLQTRNSGGAGLWFVARWIDETRGERLATRLNEHQARLSHRRDGSDPLGLPGTGRAAVHAKELGILLIAFPFDRRLPMLPLVADGRYLAGRLEQALAPISGGAAIRRVDAKPVRYKPEGKCVFEIAIDWAGTGPALPGVVYGKVAKEAILHRMNLVAPLVRRLGRSIDFVVPQRLAVVDDLGLELQSQVPGRPMSDLLTAGTGPTEGRGRGVGRDAGRALRSLHGVPAEVTTHRTVEDHELLLTDNARQLAHQLPAQRSTVESLEAEIGKRLRADPATGVVCHNDFHGGNVLVGPMVGLIDFEDAAMGDSANDVGSMYAHLTDLADRHPEYRRAILAERAGFLDAYGIGDLGDRLAPFAAMHCLLLAYQSLRYPAAGTESRVESLLGAATASLSGVRP